MSSSLRTSPPLGARERCVSLTLLHYCSTGGSIKEVEQDSARQRDAFSGLKRDSDNMKDSEKEELWSLGRGGKGCSSVEAATQGPDAHHTGGEPLPRDNMDKSPLFEGTSVLCVRLQEAEANMQGTC